MTCPLKEISRSNKTEPYAVYLGHGALIKEDECWTMCQQQIKKLKKKVEELDLHIELMEERDKRRRLL